jgi:hypothetical protein
VDFVANSPQVNSKTYNRDRLLAQSTYALFSGWIGALYKHIKLSLYLYKQVMVNLVFAFDHRESDFEVLELACGNAPCDSSAYRQRTDCGNKLYIHNFASCS